MIEHNSTFAAIDAFAEQNREAILRDITRLVAKPSVEGEPAPGAPFGPGPRAALDEALAIAADLGLAVHNDHGYIGWADRKSTRLNSSHESESRMPSSA